MNVIENKISKKREKIINFPNENAKLIRNVITEVEKKINQKREIMYSDIINWIIRNDCDADKFNQLLLWCNYKIRFGEEFINFS